MLVTFSRKTLYKNMLKIKEVALDCGVDVAFMVKSQMKWVFLRDCLKGERVYTTDFDSHDWVNIYGCKGITVVDAFERREGVTVEESKFVENKSLAIVNFNCCKGGIPSQFDLMIIDQELKKIGFKRVSFGGSLVLKLPKIYGDEIRVGEALLTGFSSEPYHSYYRGMGNPFTIEFKVYSASQDGVVIKKGLLDIGGFTCHRVKCVTTDFTVIEMANWESIKKAGVVRLKPDYFTLLKLSRGVLFSEVRVVD